MMYFEDSHVLLAIPCGCLSGDAGSSANLPTDENENVPRRVGRAISGLDVTLASSLTCNPHSQRCSQIVFTSKQPGNKVTCKFTPTIYLDNTAGEEREDLEEAVDGIILDYSEVPEITCKVPDYRDRVSDVRLAAIKYTVSLSNDDVDFTVPTIVTMFDSKCLIKSANDPQLERLRLIEDYCLIGGKCWDHKATNPDNALLICSTDGDKYGWTELTTLAPDPTTTEPLSTSTDKKTEEQTTFTVAVTTFKSELDLTTSGNESQLMASTRIDQSRTSQTEHKENRTQEKPSIIKSEARVSRGTDPITLMIIVIALVGVLILVLLILLIFVALVYKVVKKSSEQKNPGGGPKTWDLPA